MMSGIGQQHGLAASSSRPNQCDFRPTTIILAKELAGVVVLSAYPESMELDQDLVNVASMVESTIHLTHLNPSMI